MIPSNSRVARHQRPLRATTAMAAWVSVVLLGGALHAKPIPDNLGNGLDKVVESNLARKSASKSGATRAMVVGADGLAYVSQQAAAYGANSFVDSDGRILVRINADGTLTPNKLRKSLRKRFSSFSVTAVDKTYQGVGVMNAYVSLDEVATLAQTPGVKSVILELRPQLRRANVPTVALETGGTNAVPGAVYTKLGRAFDQGVTQHRVDQINKFYNPSATLDYEGIGMQIGFMSDSYARLTAAGRTAADSVANFDLPGSASDPVNTTPVDLLEDYTGSGPTDEGRAMTEIGHKMAPKARLAFATAFTGEVGFANNIRALAGIPGFTKAGQTFAADVVCDDVGYGDEPFYQDGIIGAGVDDAAAYGVSYFSSASNDPGINGYESPARFVANGTGLTAAAGNTALTNTNIDLTNVPPALYAGGFHNFNPNGQDVAQLVNVNAAYTTVIQWDEPFDQNTSANLVQPPLYTASGTITSATPVVFTVPGSLTQGTLYQLDVTASAGSTVDVTVTVKDPSGNTIVNAQDTGTDESARFFAPVTGSGYTISIGRFGTTTGAFDLKLSASTGFAVQGVKTDVNLLAFDATTGAYLPDSSLVANNFATNQPIELGVTAPPTGATQVQYVIARGNVAASNGLTHLRYLISTNGSTSVGPAEYFNYDTVATRGHSMAAGCNGSAAYSVFRPNIPEGFTSPGPVVIYFDKLGNRLATPNVRLQPTIAAADAANNSFFANDSTNDQDASPNFSGTSAASPHGAAVAALVLQAAGGRRSLTPTQVTRLLQTTAFPHDLDPYRSTGTARVLGGSTGSGKVTISAVSNGGTGGNTGSNDNNAISVSYIGGSSLTSLVFNPAATAATAGNTSGGNNGNTYTGNVTGGTVTYFENNFPGMVWAPASKPFTIGSASTVPLTALTGGIPLYSGTPPSPSTTQFWTMTINFNSGVFTGGNLLSFSVGRAVQHTATTGNAVPIGAGTTAVNYQADLLGGSISLPSGAGNGVGMTFTGTTADGGTFTGTINNRVGNGYATLDGYGFLNAEAAVRAAAPTP